jgi:hypothetical protein
MRRFNRSQETAWRKSTAMNEAWFPGTTRRAFIKCASEFGACARRTTCLQECSRRPQTSTARSALLDYLSPAAFTQRFYLNKIAA